MKKNRSVKTAISLGIISLGAVLVSHLALTDIYHGKGDLRLEWNVLRVCFAVIITFQVYALVIFWRMVRKAKRGENVK